MLTVQRIKGKSNKYKFPNIELFDKISPEFLDNPTISPQAKEYYMDLQQYLYINHEEGVANTTYSNAELAEKTNHSISSIKRYNTELLLAGIMTEKEIASLDNGGFKKVAKIFDLAKLCQ